MNAPGRRGCFRLGHKGFEHDRKKRCLHRLRQTEYFERRGGDSNSRYPFGQTGFRNRHIQPLCHLSKAREDYSMEMLNSSNSTDVRIPYGCLY